MKKYVIWFLGGLALLMGVVWLTNQSKNTSFVETGKGVVLINSQKFDELAKDPNTFIVDVHIPEQNHIPGTDAIIAYNEIEDNPDQLPGDKDTPILVYCRSGSMSREASEKLVRMGYTAVYDLEGGINAYRESHVSIDIFPKTHDFGTVVYGDIPTVEFTLTNFTSAPLEITRVSTSCGCTNAEVAKKQLDPYESTAISVSFNPAVHKDNSGLGDALRTVYIDTDNPNFPQVTAEITANVVKR